MTVICNLVAVLLVAMKLVRLRWKNECVMCLKMGSSDVDGYHLEAISRIRDLSQDLAHG